MREPRIEVRNETTRRHEHQVEMESAPSMPQLQMEMEKWELPPSQGDHDLLEATPDTLQEIVDKCILQR